MVIGMRLIDADALYYKVKCECNPYGKPTIDFESGKKVLDWIEKAPTVERPHGTWVDVPKYKGFYVCSKCLERLNGDFERFDHWEMKKDNFCSVCGSDNRKLGDNNG